MKRLCIFTILAAAALTACVKENAPAPVSEIEDTVDEVISFDFSVRPMADADDAGTKALVSASGLLSSGNQIKVYDVFKGTTSTAEYFNTTLTSDGSGWGTEDEYKWTRTGTHNFFGWFLKDASGNNTDFASLFGSASYSDYTLTLPAIEMTASTPQFDFLYSDVIQKNRGDGSSDPTESSISLQMKHLFTAFSLGVKNNSEIQTITIKKVEVRNLANKKSATLAFNITGENTTITPNFTTYSDGHTTNPDFSYTGQFTVGPGASLANILSSNSSNELCYLMWPQTADELDDAEVYIEYERNGNAQEPATFKIPQTTWDAGKINHITVVFTTHTVQLEINNLAVTGYSENSITLSWDKVEGASGYQYKVNENGTFNDANVSISGNVCTLTIDNLNQGTEYTIYIKAVSDDSYYSESEVKYATKKTKTKLLKPEIIERVITAKTIKVSWDPVENASGYTIYYIHDNKAGEPQSLNSDVTEYMFQDLDPEQTYTICLYASGDVIEYSNSDVSDKDIQTHSQKKLEPVINLDRATYNSLTFSWNCGENESKVQSYDVYWNSPNNNVISGGTQTSYTKEGLNNNTEYTIYVVANGDNDEYLTSDIKSKSGKTTNSSKPAVPTPVISSISSTESSISISWTEEWDGGEFEISTSEDFSNPIVTGLQKTAYTFSGLNPDTWYDYYLRACPYNGNFEKSAPYHIHYKTQEESQTEKFWGEISPNQNVIISPTSNSDIYNKYININEDVVLKITYSHTDIWGNITFADGWNHALTGGIIPHNGKVGVVQEAYFTINSTVRGEIHAQYHNDTMSIIVPGCARVLKIEVQ